MKKYYEFVIRFLSKLWRKTKGVVSFLLKIKLKLLIAIFPVFLSFFLVIVFCCRHHEWCKDFEQVGGIILTFLLTIIIMLDNSRQLEKSTNDKIKTIETSSKDQINAIESSTKDQISTIKSSTEIQINTIKESTQNQIETIKDSTQRQIDNFVIQTQGIISRLEETVAVLVKMSEQYSEQLELQKKKVKGEEDRLEALLKEQEENSKEKLRDKQRKMPQLYTRVDVQDYIIFWKHFWIYFYNKGGDSKNISIRIRFLNSYNGRERMITQSYNEIKRDKQMKLDLGNARNLDEYDFIVVEIATVRDVLENEYRGIAEFGKNDNSWKKIEMKEIG
jgi:hypothetical protein